VRALVVDAFTDVAFRGNPAGVVLLDAPAGSYPDTWLQSVAAELRHSETAFCSVRPDGAHDLRWFTPTVEVTLCGHATLATTHVLATAGAGEDFTFHTLSGELRATVQDGEITLDFPARVPVPVDAPAGLAAALGAEPVSVHANGLDLVVELASAAAVGDLRPGIAALAAVEARGVIVTAAGGDGVDFVSRFFGPRVGVDEDPVTGSAHCALAPFWSARLGRTALVGRQLSARGGVVAVEVRGDRVLLGGRAVTVLDGELL
jgi:PhzF family phenazine biosynthesis protein